MPVDTKLVDLIANSGHLTKEEVFTFLKQAGYPSENIADSYGAASIRQRVSPGHHKQLWQSVLLSLVLPGLGHIYLGSVPAGILILMLYGLAWWATLNVVGTLVGSLILFGIVVWAMVSSYGAAQRKAGQTAKTNRA